MVTPVQVVYVPYIPLVIDVLNKQGGERETGERKKKHAISHANAEDQRQAANYEIHLQQSRAQ